MKFCSSLKVFVLVFSILAQSSKTASLRMDQILFVVSTNTEIKLPAFPENYFTQKNADENLNLSLPKQNLSESTETQEPTASNNTPQCKEGFHWNWTNQSEKKGMCVADSQTNCLNYINQLGICLQCAEGYKFKNLSDTSDYTRECFKIPQPQEPIQKPTVIPQKKTIEKKPAENSPKTENPESPEDPEIKHNVPLMPAPVPTTRVVIPDCGDWMHWVWISEDVLMGLCVKDYDVNCYIYNYAYGICRTCMPGRVLTKTMNYNQYCLAEGEKVPVNTDTKQEPRFAKRVSNTPPKPKNNSDPKA